MSTSCGSSAGCDRVLFVERSGELHQQARLRHLNAGAEVRASVKSAIKSADADPKPGDLSMSRLKPL